MGATTEKIMKNIKLGLDLQGGFEVLYDVKPLNKDQKIDQDVLASTAEALDRRINVLGVSEPVINIEGNNRIRVQLAGVEDQNEARKILSTEANLSFRDVNDKLMMDGSDLVQGGASQSFDEQGRPCVTLKLKSADKFREVTQKIVNMGEPNNRLVIWMDFEEGKDSFKKESQKEDPKYLSAPSVSQVFNQDSVSIVGNFTVDEATTLANLLNAGALPVQLDEVYSTSVGAQFGAEALHKMITAGIIGIIAIFAFMIIYYRFPGFIASVALAIYVFLTLLIFDWMNAVLTLPGIAALILGVGMAVDANVITFERIKEELKVGRSLKAAYKEGNKNSLTSIIDANLTTILAGGVLFYYGTSSVKGFATTLIISILVSFITAVYGSRFLLGLWVNSNALNKKFSWFGVKQKDIRDISEHIDPSSLPTKFDRWDLVKHRNKFFVISGLMIVIGIVSLFVFKLNLSIDFTSGTRIEVQANDSITTSEFQKLLKENDIVTDNIVISGDDKNIGVARIKGVLSKDEIAELKADFKDKLGVEPNVSTVTPTVGKELVKNAIKAVAIASIGIIIYVAFRFEMKMAVPAVIALIHDAFLMITIFSLTHLEVDLTFIAAVLTIVGYSINDTIVTFDRLRENMRKKRRIRKKEELAFLVNQSLRQTMTRSINTVLTTIIAVLAVLFFGSEAISNFALALLVGLITGVYSSVCLAAQMYYVWKAKELDKKGVIVTYKEKKKISRQPQV